MRNKKTLLWLLYHAFVKNNLSDIFFMGQISENIPPLFGGMKNELFFFKVQKTCLS